MSASTIVNDLKKSLNVFDEKSSLLPSRRASFLVKITRAKFLHGIVSF